MASDRDNTPEMGHPAVAGGTPAKTAPFASEKRYGEAELSMLAQALEQGTLFYAQGKMVYRLEEVYAARLGVPHAVACSSGTASIHTALMAAGISPGDEVITAPITDMGTIVPILWQGAVPVFADVDPETFVMSAESVADQVTDRTRAVVAVHLWGNACDLNAMREICDARGITLIEDCAQAFGCTYDGKPIGTVGDIGCFSLNEFKHISCGDGGLVVTRDAATAQKLRLATDKGYNRTADAANRNATFLAGNYRMTELQAAVALAQLEKLDSIVQRRRQWCSDLSERLQGTPGVRCPKPTPGCDPSWWFYMMRVDEAEMGCTTDEFANALRAEGLPVGAHYIVQCVYEYPVFVGHSPFARGNHAFERVDYGKGMCPEAESLLDTALILAVNQAYSRRDLDETALGIRRAAEWFAARGQD